MPKHLKQRTVSTQSTDFYNDDFEGRAQPARLIKKPGFRNLLRQSVTVISKENEEEIECLSLKGHRKSRSIQTELDADLTLLRYKSRENQERDSSIDENDECKTPSSVERGTRSSYPGTSRRMSIAFSGLSVASQLTETLINRLEGSTAVVYDYGEKSREHSLSSNFPYFYGSQGSRRFSDETVLLIQDYQSYDQANVARRQDVELSNRRSRSLFCCRKKEPTPVEPLTRPLPLNFVEVLEGDEIVCRICHEGEEVEPLIEPCLCKGSVGTVHARCLKNWLEQSHTSRCELCNYPYAVIQTRKYTKCVSIQVFYRSIIDRRALAYDIISFVIITPLTLVGVVMCIQASVFSAGDGASDTNYQMGYITKVGMIMLSGTIVVAYGVWLYTLISFHYKSWKKWYENCYNVEVLPVRMTSEERLEAARRLSQEMNRRQLSREQNSTLLSVFHSPYNYSFYQRQMSPVPSPGIHHNR